MTLAYFVEDVGDLVREAPYLQLAKRERAVRFLTQQADYADECRAALLRYPAQRIEPLEFFYTCLRHIGPLDINLLGALLADHTWRGIVWGSLLTILEPRQEFADTLLDAKTRVPLHNHWIVDCALAELTGEATSPGDLAFVEVARRCRDHLSGLPRPITQLRLRPSESQLRLMSHERMRILAAYTTSGLEAALQAAEGTLVASYTQDRHRSARSLYHK